MNCLVRRENFISTNMIVYKTFQLSPFLSNGVLEIEKVTGNRNLVKK